MDSQEDEDVDNFSLFKEYITRTGSKVLLEGCTEVQAIMGETDFIPFHIPPGAFYEETTETSTVETSDIGSFMSSSTEVVPCTPLKLYKALKTHEEKEDSEIDDGVCYLKLPPTSELKSESSKLKVRMQKKPYLKRFPEELLGPKGEINFLDLLNVMKNKVTDENYYLKHALPKFSSAFHPFNFMIVPSCKINPQNFYTICRKGMFHNRFGAVSFKSLDELESSYNGYMKLSKLKFCRQFLLIKIFKQWKKDIWMKRWINRKCDLEPAFLYSRVHMREVLYNVKELCGSLALISFFDDSVIENIDIVEFPEKQFDKTINIVGKLLDTLEMLQSMVKEACDKEMEITECQIEENTFNIESLRGNRFKFLKILAKKPVSYAATEKENKKRKECIFISRGIKIVDYMVQDALFNMILNSSELFLTVLKKHLYYLNEASVYASDDLSMVTGKERTSSPLTPMFPVELQVTNDLSNFIISPDLSEFKNAFHSIFAFWIEQIKHIPSCLDDDIFLPFTSPVINGVKENHVIGSPPKFHEFIEDDYGYCNKKKLILFVLQDNYELMTIYTKRLAHVLDYYKWCCLSSDDEINKLDSFDHLKELYGFTKNMASTCHKVTVEQEIGLFYLDMKNFKSIILPCVEQVSINIGKRMADIYNERFLKLSHELIVLFERLDMDPKTCPTYIAFLENLDEIKRFVAKHEATLGGSQGFEDTIIDAGFGDLIADTYEAKKKAKQYLDEYEEKFQTATQKAADSKEVFVNNVYRYVSDLLDRISTLRSDFLETNFYDKDKDPLDIDIMLQEFTERIENLKEPMEKCKIFERAANLPATIFSKIEDLPFLINLVRLMWDCKTQLDDQISQWFLSDFDSINPEEMQQSVTKYLKNIAQFEKYFPPNNIVPELRKKVEELRDKIPCINVLRNPNIKPRHWRKIGFVLNVKIDNIGRISLKALEKLNIYEHYDEIADISVQASSESSLEGLLKKIEDAWKALEFTVLPHKDSKDVFILSALDDVNAVLDETNINLTTIAGSRSVGPIKPRVDDWVAKIDLFSKTLEEWSNCQTNWLYLEPIFSAPDIQRQLPNEAKMFFIVDKSWKVIMRRTAKNPLALTACTVPGLCEEFERNNDLLEEILKCLEAYLESKRVVFPRFYFLSNEELLEILAQTRNPHAVQPHLRKCFDAIAQLGFAEKLVFLDGTERIRIENEPVPEGARVVVSTDILTMMSPESESIKLPKGLKARGNVEEWLGKVEAAMFTSLYQLTKHAIDDYATKLRTQWVLLHPSQIVLTVSQIMWARSIHAIMAEKNVLEGVKGFEQTSFKDLSDLASMVRGKLEKTHRSTLCALITIDVHARDIISGLVKLKVDKSTNFEWVKQLRYYWDLEIDNCVACMASARHVYGYEYLGVSPRLVVTPLTDKCYLCLMGALQLDLGGAPAGPAGTGKTETTKDLAKALAIQCVVFNCSDGLDYKMMGRFFSGLAQSGAWCCFDEFNRIDIEVLSVIAQQLITIRNAKAAKLSRFMFEGREIKLIPQCATFITMNPGYAGRTELPDNLKSVFRPFAMMVPDYGLIAEVILYSEGFESSKGLAQKMVNMYKLCSEQLSQQDHYDFGMRAVKSVLVMAGSLKRENPDKREDIVLIRALRDSNLPKFLKDDADLFRGILNDLFPGVVLPEHDYGLFQKAMEFVVNKRRLQSVPCTYLKTIQLFETMVVRWGVMTVGPTGGGKTTVLNVLRDTLTKLYEDGVEGPYFRPVTIHTLNPKSVTMGELYGEVNLATLEWRDGLLGIFVRMSVRCTKEIHQWVVCDGPVDAVWIENLNTVLDDNKMLCLANSERIKLTSWVHMCFEVMDLSQASPATVSRCGMVYVDPNELGWCPYVKTWAQTLIRDQLLPEQSFEFLIETFETYIDKGLEFIRRNCSVAIHQVDISKIAMLCSLLQNVFKINKLAHTVTTKNMKPVILQSFVIAYLWSLGGNILENDREPFGNFVMNQFADVKEIVLPEGKDFWKVHYDPYNKELVEWAAITPEFKYNPEVQFFDMLVPTVDTVCFGYLMRKLLEENHPVFFTGTTGVGKSVIAKEVLNAMTNSKLWVVNVLNFSAQTSSMRTQEMIELKLEKKKKTLMGAPYGKRMAVFVDDVNMPKLETYGAQAPIELLRQFLDFKGLYDRDKLFWKNIEGMVLCCACAPPGGGRNPLTPRFVRHFGMLSIPSPSVDSLKVIFVSILKGFLEEFVAPIPSLADSVVKAAVDLYGRIAEDLLPTPAKSHYVFNLRDLSKCIQGVLQANPGVLREPRQLHRLFFHECSRVFHDRLINEEDKTYFLTLLREICIKHLQSPVVEFVVEGDTVSPPILLFGDFINTALDKKDRIYDEISDIPRLKTVLLDATIEYNLVKATDMKLIFFMDALEHLCRLARILRAERGNALLVGVGGMGKQSLTKLGSHLNVCNCFQIELTQTYDYNSFHEDLRKLYFGAGALNQDSVFLFTDTQIVVEEFVEDINNILNSGEVPNLFEGDELEKCIIACRQAAKAAGVNEGNRDAIFDFFISRVRSRLHVVLCMSPVGDAFRRRCRMFPSLVNCCTIDWFMPWPEEALVSVAQDSLKTMVEKDLVTPISNICYTMHSSVEKTSERFYNEMKRHYYVTPSSYLDLLKLYGQIFDTRKSHIISTKERINNGLMKLYETNELVAFMKIQLQKLEPELAEKNEETLKLMKHLVVEKTAADEVRTVVLEDEAVAKEKANECQLLKDDAQADLDLALPAMEAAVKALEALNKNDINEVKVFNKPPYLVKFVMEAVCLLLGAKQDWPSAKLVLGDSNFLKKLQDYDKDNIPDSLLKKLKKYIEDPQFVPSLIEATSRACKSLCLWVRAIDTYAKVYRVVEPKRQKLNAAEKELNEIMSILRAKQAKLADVEAQIQKLEQLYDSNLREKAKLEATLQLCKTRMNRAGRLTSALADEQERWENGVKTLTGEMNNLVGDVLVAAASVAYLGAFTSNYRDELNALWLGEIKKLNVPASAAFSLMHVLADPYEVSVWNSCGLPNDKVSVENGIYVTRASRWPLMIDPQEQANRWIRQMEADNNLRIVKLTDGNFMRVLESSIRLGLPILIWEVGETLDPTLKPVLTKSIFYQAGRALIRLGDADVEYDPNFRLYVTTKLSNPHYLPEICIQVTLVNFTVTPSGLEDQLLADVVRIERPDLEKQRSELIVRINKDKGQLKSIEDKILKMLFASSGNILDDEELVETLNESKETSAVISTRLQETEETEAKITVAREGYRSVAERGSVLYFVVAHLAEIDPMYQFSLKYFKMIFNNVIESTPASPTLEERLSSLMKEITLAIYNNVSRGLFEKDKLVFSSMLCANILIKAKIIPESHWVYLLRGPVGSTELKKQKPSFPAITNIIWSSCCFLEDLDKTFENITDYVLDKINLVVGDYVLDIALRGESSHPCKIDWNEKLDLFQRMMLMKALKEEKVIFALTEYVKVMLGKAFVESPLVSLNLLYADMNNITPLIFVLSTGSDPVAAFLRFASETGNKDRISSISLGQGQGPIAQKIIEKGKRKGDWVFLQNCHLAASWMLSMEKIIMEIADNPRDVNVDFRLFMSSMPSKAFPVSVLQNSVKVTNEPPKGLRSNLKRAFTELQEDFFEGHPIGGNWRKIIFGICFFHAVILERKKYGPLGWNIMYEFSESDRECALLNLNLFCSKEKRGIIPWDALEYITGEVTYGGRVTDFWDQRTLKTVLKKFFSPPTLVPGYKYSDSGTYYAPESSEIFKLDHYRQFIEDLPLIEEPEIFGMHENANIAFQTKETSGLLGTILNVEVKESGGAEGKSSDDVVSELADAIAKKIATKISTDDILQTHITRDMKGRLPSLTTVLLQEVDRFNKMLRVIHSSIDNLKKAIKGFVVMSDLLEEVYKAFMNNMVPKMWSSVSYPSLKSLGSWVRDLELRIDFIAVWVVHGQPSSFWLSGFFFPQGFMTGVLQNYARKYDFPIDELKIDFRMKPVVLYQSEICAYRKTTKSEDSGAYKHVPMPSDGVLVHGLFLDAARFELTTMVLADPYPGELNPPLPVLELMPSGEVPSIENRYQCPLYKTSVRAGVLSTTGHSTNFVIAVLLPSAHDQSYWILKGTALLTQVTD